MMIILDKHSDMVESIKTLENIYFKGEDMLFDTYEISGYDRDIFLTTAKNGLSEYRKETYDKDPYKYIGYLEESVRQAISILQKAQLANSCGIGEAIKIASGKNI